MTTAQSHIADTLNRAQLTWETSMRIGVPDANRRDALAWFIHHVTSAVLLEHVRRLDPALADQLTTWLCTQDSIFADGYAGELLYQWRQQVAAGEPMDPIGPRTTDQVPT